MKVLVGLLLLATIALTQARTAVNAAVYENEENNDSTVRSIIHMRVARNDGTVGRAAGSYISPTWVLTSSNALTGLTFGWMSFYATYAHSPRLLFEFGTAAINRPSDASHDVVLVNFPRDPSQIPEIQPIRLDWNFNVESLKNEDVASWYYADGVRLTSSAIETAGWESCVEGGSQGDNRFCAFGEAACQAYGGTPLVRGGSQIGLVSHSTNCDDDEQTSALIVTNLSGIIDWIENTTGVSFDNPQPESGSRETVRVASL